jgi:hypothetical protein
MVGHVIGLVELDQQYFGVLQDLLTFPQHFTMSQILNATHDQTNSNIVSILHNRLCI